MTEGDDRWDEVRKYEPKLRAYFRKALKSRQDAADLLHDAYVRFAESERSENQRARSVPQFLFTIARNLIFDRWRRDQTVRIDTNAHPEAIDPLDESVDLEASAVADQQRAMLLSVLQGLPDQCREVFLLRREEGLSTKEVGTRLGIASSTVEKHMTRALEALRPCVMGERQTDQSPQASRKRDGSYKP